ncbi:barstar family protein [Streptomyces sp. NPDC021356]|uniref:barstar family protein n=1 Tax=Streptomyces sp. NPDC021356 TaxID=3154900 RepID=UPI0033C9D436
MSSTPPQGVLYRLVDAESRHVLVAAEDIRGFFVDPEEEPPPAVTFLRTHRCDPARRRTENARLEVVGRDGGTVGAYHIGRASAAAPDPSAGAGERPDADWTFHGHTCEYPEAGRIWPRWADGGPAEPGEWTRYPSVAHESWLHVVQTAWFTAGRRATRYGTAETAVIDGSTVTTRDSFYCALGEAVNGPGGYFGSNLDALHDCLRSMRRDSDRPLGVLWHDAAVSREALGSAYTDAVVSVFAESAVDVRAD